MLKIKCYNNVTLVGRLTHDPELKYTQNGQPVCRFNIAINEYYKDAEGKVKEDTCFIPIVTWRELALRCNESLKKGIAVFVVGKLKSREWNDKEGKRHRSIEVVSYTVQILEKKAEGEEVSGAIDVTVPAEEKSEEEEEVV